MSAPKKDRRCLVIATDDDCKSQINFLCTLECDKNEINELHAIIQKLNRNPVDTVKLVASTIEDTIKQEDIVVMGVKSRMVVEAVCKHFGKGGGTLNKRIYRVSRGTNKAPNAAFHYLRIAGNQGGNHDVKETRNGKKVTMGGIIRRVLIIAKWFKVTIKAEQKLNKMNVVREIWRL